MTAGLYDSRVHYWEPAKWVARLRDRKTDDRVILLKCKVRRSSQRLSCAVGRIPLDQHVNHNLFFSRSLACRWKVAMAEDLVATPSTEKWPSTGLLSSGNSAWRRQCE